MHFFTASSVNPGGYYMGSRCGATPDGRHSGRPFAIGHAPTAGQDTSGITAFLNSVAKADPANGGVATNVKLGKEYFTRSRGKLEAMFNAFWKQGGQQASVTVVSQQDLKDAMDEPEKYPHVLVRVGGWSARFVELEREVQEDILQRTAY
jgi:pyruvate-formate lyase